MLRESLCVLGFQVACLHHFPFGFCLLAALLWGCLVRSVLGMLACVVGIFGVDSSSIRLRIGLRSFVLLICCSLRRYA